MDVKTEIAEVLTRVFTASPIDTNDTVCSKPNVVTALNSSATANHDIANSIFELAKAVGALNKI